MNPNSSAPKFTLLPGEGAYAPIVEPLQSVEHLIVKGVRSNAMTRAEAQDAAQAVTEMQLKSGDPFRDTFERASMLLALAGAITDVKLLDESPTLLSTAQGSLARGVSIQRLKDLETALDIEQLSHRSENTAEIFTYRTNANTAIATNRRTNIARILSSLEKTSYLSREEYDVLYRSVGYVMHQQLARSSATQTKR